MSLNLISSFLFLLTLLLCSLGPVSCGGEYDIAGSTGFWRSRALSVFDGFCLNSTYRAVQNISTPLYRRTINIAFATGSGRTYVTNWILTLLIRERLGYSVRILDDANLAFDFRAPFYANPQRADLMVDTGYASQLGFFRSQMAQALSDSRVSYYNAHDGSERTGIYVSSLALANNPGAAYHWSDFSMGVARNPLYPQYALPYSDSRAQAVADRLAPFRQDGWDFLDRMNGSAFIDRSFGSNQIVCPPDNILFSVSRIRAGCNDPRYPSMFIPSHCYPNPRQQCAPIFSNPPAFYNGRLQNQIVNLNLSLVIAFLDLQANVIMQKDTSKQYLVFTSETVPIISEQCYYNNTNSLSSIPMQMPCYRRVDLPYYEPTCEYFYTGNVGSQYYCDFPADFYHKWGSGLQKNAPRVHSLLRSFNLDQYDAKEINNAVNGGQTDNKRIACDWIQRHITGAGTLNRKSWLSWIDPPELCSTSDYTYTINQCDESTGKQRIDFAWNLPKSCQGGVSLPNSEYVSCGYLSVSDANYQTRSGVSAAMAFSMIPLALIIIIQLALGRSNVNAALIARALQYQKSQETEQGKPKRLSRWANNFVNWFSVLPVWPLLNPFIALAIIGSLLLLLSIWFSSGSLSDTSCWIRHSFVFMGVLSIAVSLIPAMAKINDARKRVINPKHLKRMSIITTALLSAGIIIEAIGSSIEALLHSDTLILRTGAQLRFEYCHLPSGGISFVEMALIYLIIAWLLFQSTRALFLSHFSFEYSNSNSSRVTSARSNRKAPVSAVQRIQIRSLFLATLVLTVASVLLFDFSFNPTDPDAYLQFLDFQGAFILAFVPTFFLSLLILSIPIAFRSLTRPVKDSRINRKLTQSRIAAVSKEEDGPTKIGALFSDQSSGMKSVETSKIVSQSTESENGEYDEFASLSSVLADPISLHFFTQHCEANFNAEGIHFLVESKQLFRLLANRNTSSMDLMALAERLHDHYIKEHANEQLNLGFTQRENVKRDIQRMKEMIGKTEKITSLSADQASSAVASAELRAISRSAFLAVVQEVYNLLALNDYARFLTSDFIARANELALWTQTFSDLTTEEQSAVLKKLNVEYSRNLEMGNPNRAIEVTIAQSQQVLRNAQSIEEEKQILENFALNQPMADGLARDPEVEQESEQESSQKQLEMSPSQPPHQLR